MAKKKKTKTKNKTTPKLKKPSLKLSSQQKLIFGSLLIILGILLFIAFLSFFFTGKVDQSTLNAIGSREIEAQNWLNKLGAWVSDLFILKGFGVSSFIFSGLLFLSGVYVTLDINKVKKTTDFEVAYLKDGNIFIEKFNKLTLENMTKI